MIAHEAPVGGLFDPVSFWSTVAVVAVFAAVNVAFIAVELARKRRR